jgi:16S rRNA (cytosine1402-N4)-methyltransferase
MSDYRHTTVFLSEAINALVIKPEDTVVDATLGGGGHTRAILKSLNQNGRVICFDQDAAAITNAEKSLINDKRVTLVNSNFAELRSELKKLNIDSINGIIFDLGVSSYQIDTPERGFSWQNDCGLDMRMDKTADIDAKYILHNYSEEALTGVIRDYGEDRQAKRIARAIVESRKIEPIVNSLSLKKLVERAAPGKYKTDSVARVFQAIRIEVNQELKVLTEVLDQAVDLLVKGGRIAVISFHSLEDRIVKEKFKYLAKTCVCPPKFPKCVCGKKQTLKLVTKKPLVPAQQEIALNPRARSAKLRIGEKI